MICRSNVHTHSTWCDGKNTPREVVEAALAKGFTDIAFSSHSPAPFDPECPGVQDEAGYRAEILALKKEYAGRIGILCGMEQDYYAPVNKAEYDFIIGSVHYMPRHNGVYNASDGDKAQLYRTMQELYGGEGLALARAYYGLVVKNAVKFRPEIIGHFDVISKNNRGGLFFDETGKAYQSIALEAMDAVLEVIEPYGGLIEVNTGAMSRGYRDIPYPPPFVLRHLAGRRARVIITSDSHAASTLDYAFEQTEQLLRTCGFTSMVVLSGSKFADVKL